MILRTFIIFFLLLLFSNNLFAEPIVFDENLVEKNITPYVSCKVDEDDSEFKIEEKNVLNFAYMIDRGILCRFTLENRSDKDKHLF